MIAAEGHQVAAGVGPGQLQGGRVGRRSVLGELDLVGSLDDSEHRLGAFDLDRAGPREVRSQLQLTPHGVEDGRISVAERDRPQPHAVLDELSCRPCPRRGSRSPADEGGGQTGKLVVALGVGVGAARE